MSRNVFGLAAAAAVAAAMSFDGADVIPRRRGYVQTPGAFGGGNARRHGPHPAGTKLVRRFIRHSGRESIYWRDLYRQMTGASYD